MNFGGPAVVIASSVAGAPWSARQKATAASIAEDLLVLVRYLPWALLATAAVTTAAAAGCHSRVTDISEDERCEAATCNERGTCDDSSGVAVCTCDAPYGGQNCDGCMGGLKADGDMCTCCAIVQSPTFDDASHWEVTGAARIEGGVAKLPPEAACTGGSLRQRVSIPPMSYTGRLMLTMMVRSTALSPVGLGIGLDGEWLDAGSVYSGGFELRTICLGTHLAGDEIDLELAPFHVSCDARLTGTVELHFLDIVPANEADCPTSLFVPNGDFEAGDVAWSGNWSIGVQGGRDGGLVAQYDGTDAWLEGSIHVPPPDIVARPAIQLWYQAPEDVILSVRTDYTVFGGWAGEIDWAEGRACLPPWLAGRTVRLRFQAGYVVGYSSPGDFNVLLDDVAVLSDARCDWSGGFIGGDFEPLGAPNLSRSVTSRLGFSHHDGPVPVRAEDSDSYAHVDIGQCIDWCPDYGCYDALHWVHIFGIGRVPDASDAAGGPALSYRYRLQIPEGSEISGPFGTEISGPEFAAQLAPTDTWQDMVHCLPPGQAGRMGYFSLRHFYYIDEECSSDTESMPLYPLQTDNLALVNHPSCE
jgi:hypothetical protein